MAKKKLVKIIRRTYKKGEVYNFADGDDLIPKYLYRDYFENSDETRLTEDGEWMAEDRCKKSLTIVVKIYEDTVFTKNT